VADDWLVSFETNRYSVPFALIGQPVEVLRRDGQLRIFHRGSLVAEHPELPGKYQVRILPEHGPGAVARTARRVRSTTGASPDLRDALTAVEIRDLAIYEALTDSLRGETEIPAPSGIADPEPSVRSRVPGNGRPAALPEPVLAEVRS
jgi:hypothetical protein